LSSDSRYQLHGDPLDERWNGDTRNPHGGTQKVFLPGRCGSARNQDFEAEWKHVDRYKRPLHSSADLALP
jgi:hypothetical protein